MKKAHLYACKLSKMLLINRGPQDALGLTAEEREHNLHLPLFCSPVSALP